MRSCCCVLGRHLLYIYILIACLVFENMANKNYTNFTRTRSNKGFYQPSQSENYRKESEDGKGARKKKN